MSYDESCRISKIYSIKSVKQSLLVDTGKQDVFEPNGLSAKNAILQEGKITFSDSIFPPTWWLLSMTKEMCF